MSYCRFSAENWKSDIYCYAACDGLWVIHVAANRIVSKIPQLPDYDSLPTSEWFECYGLHLDAVKSAERVPINGPHDGACFSEASPGEAADRLEQLRAAGYHVPAGVIEELREEQLQSDR